MDGARHPVEALVHDLAHHAIEIADTMNRSPPPLLYNTRLALNSTLRAAKKNWRSGSVSSGLGPVARVPPAKHVQHVIVAGGFGRDSFNPCEVQDVAQRLARIATHCELVLNDGDEPSAEQPVVMGLLTALCASADEPVLLVIQSHGNLAPDGQFITELDEGICVPGTPLLYNIGTLRHAPVQIFISSCLGWSFLEGVPHLPEGSVVVVLAPQGRSVASDDIRMMNINLDKLRCLHAFSMLLLYCTNALKTKTPPSVFMPNGTIIDLECQLALIINQRLGEADRMLIHQQLDELVGTDRVNYSMALIETLGSVGAVGENDYGMALAIAAVLSGVVVEPDARTPLVPQPTIHNVIRGTVEAVQTFELPQLNLKLAGVKAMFSQRGKAVVLQDGSSIYLSEKRDRVLLKFKGQIVVLLLQKLVACEVLKVQEIQGDAETIAHFRQNGVLQAVGASPIRGASLSSFA